eukprot:scaffold199986_cov35-Tisochrysis_lutea.AAC.1
MLLRYLLRGSALGGQLSASMLKLELCHFTLHLSLSQTTFNEHCSSPLNMWACSIPLFGALIAIASSCCSWAD